MGSNVIWGHGLWGVDSPPTVKTQPAPPAEPPPEEAEETSSEDCDPATLHMKSLGMDISIGCTGRLLRWAIRPPKKAESFVLKDTVDDLDIVELWERAVKDPFSNCHLEIHPQDLLPVIVISYEDQALDVLLPPSSPAVIRERFLELLADNWFEWEGD